MIAPTPKYPPLDLSQHVGLAYKWGIRLLPYAQQVMPTVTSDDLASEIMVLWLKKKDCYNQRYSPTTYLSQLAINHIRAFVTFHRAQCREGSYLSFSLNGEVKIDIIDHRQDDPLSVEDKSQIELQDAIAALPSPLDYVIRQRLQGVYLSVIGKSLGHTKEWTRQLELKAIRQLRKMYLSQSCQP